MVKRQIENRGYVEKVKVLVKNDWPYEKTNPAQKVLLGLLKEESCPYENFSTRQIPIHMIDPLFIRDKQTIHLLPVIFCIERLLEENPDVSSVLVPEYIDCVSPHCKERINSEHIRYYLLHRMRIDAEVDKLIGETLVHSLIAKNILPRGILHLKKYQTHKYLNYVVISLKRIEKKQTESKEEKELLFSVLHCFSMHGANEEYVISQAKAACKESSVQKILLVLNILYKVHGTKKIGFATALLSHALLKRETSFYTKTIVRAVGKKHRKSLEIAKPLILDHFIYRATDDLKTDAFGTLSYLYGYASVKEFLEMEKYYLAPRLWQTERVDEYYTNLPTIFIYYAIYIHETKKGGGLWAELIEQLKNTMNNIGVEVAVTIFLAIPEPAGFFKECGINIKDLLFGHSLISILCATRKVLEEKIIPINNCVFNLIHTALSYTCQQDGKYYIQEVQEIILFLIYTGNIKGKESCCDMHCSKTQFFNQLIEKSEKHDIIQNRYMIAQDLSKEQKIMIEQLVGEDTSLYFEEASTFKEAVIRIHPYLKLRASLEFLSIKKILPLILKASHAEIHSFAQSHWAQCRRLIISLYRMYSDSKDKEALQALACFGIFGIDALEERNDISDVFLDKTVRCVNFDYEERKDYMAEFLILKIFVPIYYETHDDLLQYIIQELLKDIKTNNFTEFTDLLGKLQTSQYIIEMDAGRLQEIKSERQCAPYRRGISHAQFLINVITALAQIPVKKYQFHILHDTLAILDTLSGKKWPQRHKESLLQSYLFLMIYSLKPSHQESIREHFLPIFRDIKAGALVDLDILRCIISSAQYMNSIFTDEELLLCSRHVKDRHLTIRILEVQLQDCKNSTEKDALLTEIQKEYLKIEEKDVVFGINAEITKLSPVNLAAELKINNEHANYAYLNKEILQHKPATSQMDAKYEELFKSISDEKTPTEIFQKAEHAIQKWACTAPSYSFDRDTSSLKSFLIDIHLLQDCQILQTVPLPKALQIIKDRRELPRTYQSLRVSEIHRNLFQLLPAVPEVARAEEDALLYGVRIARKSEQCELSEKLLIRSILKDDWRVFYEKAKIHLDKNNKSLAKQALQRLMDNLPINSKYKEKAILLNTEIENSEEIYKNALSSLKTNERLYFRYGKYLEKKQPVQAFKMFCMALECGSEKAPEIIPKLIHYITGTTNPLFTRDSVASCATEMMDTVHNVDIKIFRRCYIQILTRLSHKEKTVEALLQKISLRLIEEFPSEFAWRTLSLFNNKKNTAIHKLIEKTSFTFRKLFSDVMAFTQTLSKLSMHSAGSGMVSIPSILGGSIIVSRGIPAPFDDFLSEIISISDNMYVFATLQKPKKIETITSTGCYKSFLCKANDDLRKDAGFMDLNLLLNSLFQSDNKCRAFNIRVYTVVPITEKMGIIEFVENLVTLKDICSKLHSTVGINIKEIAAEFGFTKKIVMLGRKNLEDLLKRVSPVLPTYFLRQFTHPVEWLQSRKRYTITYAVMNAVGYLMGLGDRHCENILFDSITGETVHVDLNCIFDKGHALTVPETVPFRLTQNIVAAFGPTKEEGQYKLTLERVLKFLSANRDLIVANLLGFVHDPLGEWTGRNNTKTAIQIIEKTKAKLDFDDEITKSSVLIERSTSLDSLGKMYVWWLPFI